MNKTIKVLMVCLLSLFLIAFAVYGSSYGKTPEEAITEHTSVTPADTLTSASSLALEAEAAMAKNSTVQIHLSDQGIEISGTGVNVLDRTASINAEGIYSISGTLNEGQLTVNTKGTVVLILDNVSITNSSDDALHIYDSKHTLLYLPEGSENSIISGITQEITAKDENAEDASGAAIYSKDNLSIAGKGYLHVGGYINNAIATTDHLVMLDGTLDLEAVNNGLKGKDSVTVLDGSITIICGNDGIKADNDTDTDCGNINIRGGNITIHSFADGLQAANHLTVEDGVLTIITGDGENTDSQVNDLFTSAYSFEEMQRPDKENSMMTPPDGNEMPDMSQFGFGGKMHGEMTLPDGSQMPQDMTPPDGNEMPDMSQFGFGEQTQGMNRPNRTERPQGGMFSFDQDNSQKSGQSAKGLKSDNELTISGGTITVTSDDDCIHANGNVTISGGTLILSSKDDAVHADETLTITNGDITVVESYEGIEGHNILISGGTLDITSSDDGINASGNESVPSLTITGSSIHVNAEGDGLDSNGDLIIDGGMIIVDGPVNGANGALDSGTENGGSLVCNGGTVLAIGASGMAESFQNDSAQISFIQNYSSVMQVGTPISISDDSGNVIFEYTSLKSFSSIVFSSPDLKQGKTYTVSVGNITDDIVMENTVNGNSAGFTGMQGFKGKWH